MIKIEDVNEISKLKPSEFVEKCMGLELLEYQKNMVDSFDKLHSSTRSNDKKWRIYIYLCGKVLSMEDDEKIAIANPKEVKVMTRNELAVWLQNNYWK